MGYAKSEKALRKWCKDNFINSRSLKHARDIHKCGLYHIFIYILLLLLAIMYSHMLMMVSLGKFLGMLNKWVCMFPHAEMICFHTADALLLPFS